MYPMLLPRLTWIVEVCQNPKIPEDEDEFPRIWQKWSDKILHSLNKQFEKVRLIERLATAEELATDHEKCITAPGDVS